MAVEEVDAVAEESGDTDWGWSEDVGGKWVWARLGPEAGPVLHRRPPGPRPHLGRWDETGEAAHPSRPAI